MAVRLGQELYATRLVHSLQLFEHLWCMHLQLLDTSTAQRESHLKVLAMLVNHIVQRIECGHIAALGNVADATLVLVVIIVIMIGTDIKETVTLQMNNLMYLEI